MAGFSTQAGDGIVFTMGIHFGIDRAGRIGGAIDGFATG
jgi:hypothetical protein